VIKLTQAAGLIPTGAPRALVCGTAGTLTGEDADGNTITSYPLQQGYNPIRIRSWSAGTATDVWGLY
jgi:hypothetical protein